MLKLASVISSRQSQRGAAAVEFALVAMLLFVVLLGILEIGRMLFVFNTVQEITRRAAREAVVRWVDNSDTSPAKALALFGAASPPGISELTAANIQIDYLTEDGVSHPQPFPSSPGENMTACLSVPSGCIALVKVAVVGVSYRPMAGLFPFLAIPVPAATVIMPAESLGYPI